MRSVLLTAILAAVGIVLLVYMALYIPAVQRAICSEAEKQLSDFLKTDVEIGSISIAPFNQLELYDVKIPSPDGKPCIAIDKLGAGIALWRLIRHGEIEITYAEIIGLDFRLIKPAPDKPLNIKFLIDAFKPKEPGKPPTKFDLRLHSIVLRSSRFSFDKMWLPRKDNKELIDFNHLAFSGIRADINIPRLKNDHFDIELRSLAFDERSGLKLENMTCNALLTNKSLSLKDLHILFPGTFITPSDFYLAYDGYDDIVRALKEETHSLELKSNKVTLSDFSAFAAPLGAFSEPMNLSLEAKGNAKHLDIAKLLVSTPDNRLELNLKAKVSSLDNMEEFMAEAKQLRFAVNAAEAEKIIMRLAPLSDKAADILLRLGSINLDATAIASTKVLETKASLSSSLGSLALDGVFSFPAKGEIGIDAHASTEGFNFGQMLAQSNLGSAAFDADADLRIAGKNSEGALQASIDFLELGSNRLSGIDLDLKKSGNIVDAIVESTDPNLDISADALADITPGHYSLKTQVDLRNFRPAAFNLMHSLGDANIAFKANADLAGANIDDMLGSLNLSGVKFERHAQKSLYLNELEIISSKEDAGNIRSLSLGSDWLSAKIEGDYKLSALPDAFKRIAAQTIPALAGIITYAPTRPMNFDFNLDIKPDNSLTEFFNLPIRLLVPIPISGALNDSIGRASFKVDIPYLQQGKDKLIRSTALAAIADSRNKSASLNLATLFPGKKGDIGLNLSMLSNSNDIFTDISWKFHRPGDYDGKVSLSTTLLPMARGVRPEVDVKINPSVIHVADTAWHIGAGALALRDGKIDINNISVANGQQFVHIDGTASALPTDTMKVEFSDFSLDYLFETLAINYVTFGGNATGRAVATQVLSKHPIAITDGLTVTNLSYNGALLGDFAKLKGTWNNDEKCVGIGAEIFERGRRTALVDGGVWVGSDSLYFDFDADKVNVGFLKPFMAAFSSGVEGRASGKAKLYGNFHDIDLAGRLFADTIRMKVDYTNTWYAGSDSVFISPGRIDIPAFRIYDRAGHSAKVSGTVRHHYFHEPSFQFRLSDARNLLAYDTNAANNPDWYGTVYVNGGAQITGRPGIVNVQVDVATAANTIFTYVLNDTQAAEEYTFLTFSDKRRENAERIRAARDTVPEFVARFNRRIEEENSRASIFAIDLRVSVTPEAKLIIVMDPRAGDKITARGQGPMQIAYDSETDQLRMYGKYSIDEGNYNFTLQDLIIRDFKISPGSSIAFNGDPLAATLDISASYRVNTNLTDLDKSFASDRELNRTNVPVDAMLIVKGDLQNPEIDYDIKLPTLTADVERKVKSIISTDDLMSRQIIYLLALNRFYTPEYMSTSSNGGELASVASSTISSQISNILGQISDKWSIAPSFRSDKGDFSDTEVDLALSSRLLNNRLLLNGNFGYRDRSTSQTTFVGDFDIEYLLNRSGNLRLKAYNHFNDQNYYLRSALTTQGIGVVYRRDFDNPFTFLRRKKRKEDEKKHSADSIPPIETKDASTHPDSIR